MLKQFLIAAPCWLSPRADMPAIKGTRCTARVTART